VSESQARRIIHSFIHEGLLSVIGNHSGGAKNQTRRYRLNLEKLTSTPCIDATPRMSATPSTDAHDPLHGCALPLAPMTPNTSVNIKDTSTPISASGKAIEILDYLNEKANRNFRPVKANIGLIASRLKEGATPDECKAVIDSKVAAWSANAKMAQYLRPETLFGATKFASYVGELGSTNTSTPVWERT
jgi:uncharacterized phage protein (TIGR02220 family)